MKKLLRVVALFPVLLSGLLLVVIQASVTFGAPPRALVTLDECTLPCWNNIDPPETRINAAKEMLLDAGFTLHSEYRRFRFVAYDPADRSAECAVGITYSGTHITELALTNCSGARLGDFMTILGAPEAIFAPGNLLSFRRGLVLVALRTQPCTDAFSPHTDILAVYLRATRAQPRIYYPWRGFMRHASFARFQPDLLGCS